MTNFIKESYPELFSLLQGSVTPVYLVGGAVRDLLLNHTSHDLDFIVAHDAKELAKSVANRLDGKYYLLDDLRKTARVLLKTAENKRLILDFAQMRANTLEGDLTARDFTINAIALDLKSERLIDPLHGAQNLKDGILAVCSIDSIRNDPVRVLRAVRLSLDFRLRIDDQTRRLLHRDANLLTRVSHERIRDELFRILDTDHAPSALRGLDQLGALVHVLPEMIRLKESPSPTALYDDAWEFNLARLQKLNTLYRLTLNQSAAEERENLNAGLVVSILVPFRHHLEDHFNKDLVIERSLRALLSLAALYRNPETGKENTENKNDMVPLKVRNSGKNLALSQREIQRMAIISSHPYPEYLDSKEQKEDNLKVHRFFRRNGNAGIELCLLSLAELWAERGNVMLQEELLEKLRQCEAYFHGWWEQQDKIIKPPRILTGTSLMKIFSLKPGPLVGELLEAICEAQVAGSVQDKTSNIEFARAWLSAHQQNPP